MTHWHGPAAPPGRAPRGLPAGRTLVLGGARSGKSAWAEELLAGRTDVTYVATGGERPGDTDWAERVAAHRARRPAGWTTLETVELAEVVAGTPGPILVDSLGLWLTAVLDRLGGWDGSAQPGLEAEAAALVTAWRQRVQPLVAVSEEAGSGVVPATAAGRVFRDAIGRLNARLAAESEHVVLLVAGLPLVLREPRAVEVGPVSDQ